MSRKYPMKGSSYGGRDQSRGGPRTERSSERQKHSPNPHVRPRGRGLGKPDTSVFRCNRCGRKQNVDGALAFDATCTGCRSDLHTCSNCRHIDPNRPNECRKPITVPVANKSKANQCPDFEAKEAMEFNADSSDASDARAAFDDLFDF